MNNLLYNLIFQTQVVNVKTVKLTLFSYNLKTTSNGTCNKFILIEIHLMNIRFFFSIWCLQSF